MLCNLFYNLNSSQKFDVANFLCLVVHCQKFVSVESNMKVYNFDPLVSVSQFTDRWYVIFCLGNLGHEQSIIYLFIMNYSHD